MWNSNVVGYKEKKNSAAMVEIDSETENECRHEEIIRMSF